MSDQPPPPPPPPPPKRRRGGCLFFLSIALNFILLGFLCVAVGVSLWGLSADSLEEVHHSGPSSATDKVAIIHIDGVLLEGLLSFAHKQIDTAAKDKHVKAVVLRINSPGGTITASEDLHRRILKLRDGDPEKKTSPKKVLVSMGSLAASGGYYIAAPAEKIFAEPTTITGSIGVYAAFPNVAGLAKTYGVKMEVIKRGEVKDSGNMFKEMTPEERQVWQDMVDHAYDRFLQVVETGRPALKGKMREEVVNKEMKDENGKPFQYVRRRADGGIFTADRAKDYGLVDEIGTVDDAIKAAKASAELGEKSKAISYDRPWSWSDALLGTKAPTPSGLDAAGVASATTPRLWYLMPGSEMAGMLATATAPR